jgi:hypothetical protein
MEILTKKSIDDFTCIICNKCYKTNSGLWKHNVKIHKVECIQNCTLNHQTRDQNVYINLETSLDTKTKQTPIYKPNTNNNPNPNPNPDTNLNLTINPNSDINTNCKFCKKILSNRHSRWRHEQKCQTKNNFINRNEINELRKENAEIKSMLSELLKSSKVHPKTLQKINKNLINGNNNNINTGTVNNIQIVKFGSEDIKSILSDKEIKKILNCKYKSIEESIKIVHFNDDRPEYRNIYITNLRDNIAYVYNGNKFEAVQKHSVINQLIDQHMNNIEVSYDDYKNKLPERTIEILDKLIEKIQDEHTSMIDEENNKEFKNYKQFKINEVKLMIYNETGNNTEVIKLKYNNSIFNKSNNKEIDV